MLPVFLSSTASLNTLNNLTTMRMVNNTNSLFDSSEKENEVNLNVLDEKELIRLITSKKEQFHFIISSYLSPDFFKQSESFNSFAKKEFAIKIESIKQSIEKLKEENKLKYLLREDFLKKLSDLGFTPNTKMFNRLACSIKLNINFFEETLRKIYTENKNILSDYKTIIGKKYHLEKLLRRPFGEKLYGKKYKKVCEDFKKLESLYKEIVDLEKFNCIFKKNYEFLKFNYENFLDLNKYLHIIDDEVKEAEQKTYMIDNYLNDRYVAPEYISEYIKEFSEKLSESDRSYYDTLASFYSDKILNSDKEELIDIISTMNLKFKRSNLNSPAVILVTEKTLENIENENDHQKQSKKEKENKEDSISENSEIE